VGRAHIAHFGGIEGIAAAKSEIYDGLGPQGTGIFNLADAHTCKMYEKFGGRFSKVFTFGTPAADLHFTLEKFDSHGLKIKARIGQTERVVLVPVWGEHNVMNLCCASALAFAAGVSPEQIFMGLGKCKTGWGRNQWVKTKSGATVLFDGYNANPDSFSALLANTAKAVGDDQDVIAVFGEMREQGSNAAKEHFELGKQTAQSRVQRCLFFGESAADFQRGWDSVQSGKKLVISDTYKESLALELKSMLTTKSLVLVKGSRGGALERVVSVLDPLDFTTK
jgi:UDP-N-acetylmuramoyl-tripeptide--D-alanyl-D-alanine ligase